MTRMIDADALNKKLCETTIFIEDGEVFQRMINDAPTIEPDGDTISRQDALKPFCIAPDGTRIPEVDCDNFPVEFSVEFIKKHLLSLPSAESHYTGCSGCVHYDQQQTALICRDCKRSYRDMYEE